MGQGGGTVPCDRMSTHGRNHIVNLLSQGFAELCLIILLCIFFVQYARP